jgi:hypothetical protein
MREQLDPRMHFQEEGHALEQRPDNKAANHQKIRFKVLNLKIENSVISYSRNRWNWGISCGCRIIRKVPRTKRSWSPPRRISWSSRNK